MMDGKRMGRNGVGTPISPGSTKSPSTVTNVTQFLANDSPNVPFNYARSFVRVRPWVGNESKVVPEKQIVPRPGLDFDPPDLQTGWVNGLSVLDPPNRFKPRKAGHFTADCVLWSFVDETLTPAPSPSGAVTSPAFAASPTTDAKRRQAPALPATQADVYNMAGAPLADNLTEGFNVACVVTGGPKSGKAYTMVGDEYWAGEPRGIIPRFLFDMFERHQRSYREDIDSQISVECFAITNDAIHDLQRRYKPTEELKVKEEADGIVVNGGIQTTVEDFLAAEPVLKAAVHSWKKRYSHAHLVVTLRVTDVYTFHDPTAPEAALKKKRKSFATFVVLAGSHLGFQRCLDAAIAVGIGEHAKIPSRDSHLTRLCADLFGGNCSTSFVTCVSPYFESTKDAMVSLPLASKLNCIKCQAKQNTDSSINELRKLDQEVRGLNVEVEKTNETVRIVQEEFDKRTDALRERQRISNEHKAAYESQEDDRYTSERVKDVAVFRVQMSKDAQQEEKQRVENEMNWTKKEEESLKKEAAALGAAVTDGFVALEELEVKMTEQRAETERVQEEVVNYQAFEGEVHELDDIIRNSGKRQKAIRERHTVKTKKLGEDKGKMKAELDVENQKLPEVQEKHDDVKKVYDKYAAQRDETKKLEDEIAALEKEEKSLNDEVAGLEAEVKQLEDEKAKAGCCVVS